MNSLHNSFLAFELIDYKGYYREVRSEGEDRKSKQFRLSVSVLFTKVMSGLSYLVVSETLGNEIQMFCTTESIMASSHGGQDYTKKHTNTQIHIQVKSIDMDPLMYLCITILRHPFLAVF